MRDSAVSTLASVSSVQPVSSPRPPSVSERERKSVQFPLLRELLGGYEGARLVHFFAMTGLVAFVAVHLAMVALVPRTLLTMLRGR